jgi:hypothetical protein
MSSSNTFFLSDIPIVWADGRAHDQSFDISVDGISPRSLGGQDNCVLALRVQLPDHALKRRWTLEERHLDSLKLIFSFNFGHMSLPLNHMRLEDYRQQSEY